MEHVPQKHQKKLILQGISFEPISSSVTEPHKCVSAVSFAISFAIISIIDIHIINEGECGLQSCGGWITCWKHGIGLVWNILMFLMW
jgi:hypothetical protein